VYNVFYLKLNFVWKFNKLWIIWFENISIDIYSEIKCSKVINTYVLCIFYDLLTNLNVILLKIEWVVYQLKKCSWQIADLKSD